ncbi:M15 family metallopeptidase, partial [Nostoc sp. NIES-2111]
MPIIAPEVEDGLPLGRSSVSSNTDTYTAPRPVYDTSKVDGLVAAARRMGVIVEDAGAQQAQRKEQQALEQVDYWAGQVYKELGTKTVKDTQIGTLLPEQSVTVQGRVLQKLGEDAAFERVSQVKEQLLQDPALRLDPAAMDRKLAELEAEAISTAQDNPIWGAGYIRQTRAYLKQIREAAQGERSTYYDKQQEEQLQRDYDRHVQKNGPAYRGAAPLGSIGDDDDEVPNLRGALVSGKDKSHVSYLNREFATRIDAMIAGAPEEIKGQIKIASGYRSNERQAQIYAEAVRKYGSEEAARKWAAPPGKSNHNHGQAVDLKYLGPEAKRWVHDNAEKYGLYFPLKHEDWHLEMRGGRREGAPNHRHDVNPDADGEDSTDPVASVTAKIVGNPSVEGTGRNPRSSAVGVGQFVDGTWIAEVKRQAPEYAQRRNEDILALRSDPAFAERITRGFTAANAEKLKAQGLEVDETNLYLMHFAGEGDGPKIIRAADNTPIERVMSPDSLAANPHLAGKTVGQVKQWAAEKMDAPVSPAMALQNGTRAIDAEYAATSSLDNIRRREIMSKHAISQALNTGDSAYLDAFPPELMTPALRAEFVATRRKLKQMEADDYREQRQREADAREDQTRAMIDEINKLEAGGEAIDPRKYVQNERAYNYARQLREAERNITEYDSKANAEGLEDTLSAAAVKGDYSSVLGEDYKYKTPSKRQLQDVIRN